MDEICAEMAPPTMTMAAALRARYGIEHDDHCKE
jgi:hypothetical protein